MSLEELRASLLVSTSEYVLVHNDILLEAFERLEQAEQAVARVREVAETCTDKFLTMALFEALDGDGHG